MFWSFFFFKNTIRGKTWKILESILGRLNNYFRGKNLMKDFRGRGNLLNEKKLLSQFFFFMLFGWWKILWENKWCIFEVSKNLELVSKGGHVVQNSKNFFHKNDPQRVKIRCKKSIFHVFRAWKALLDFNCKSNCVRWKKCMWKTRKKAKIGLFRPNSHF